MLNHANKNVPKYGTKIRVNVLLFKKQTTEKSAVNRNHCIIAASRSNHYPLLKSILRSIEIYYT